MTQKKKLIAVVGPTGSGKSQLALSLAEALGGQLICTDSMQVYQQFDIGTAKPTLEEQKRIPHHQLDVVAPDESYSAGRYEADADKIIAQLHESKVPVILVGGTGLYFDATIDGICETPQIPPEIKQEVAQWHSENGLSYCYEQLKQKDPLRAKQLHSNDTTRILRALEVVLATGKSMLTYQEQQSSQKKYEVLSVGYHHERAVLYERINQRTYQMLDAGWVAEVEELLKTYSADLKPFRAIGYKQIVDFLNGAIPYESMVSLIQQKTRNYAKRQGTWFRKNETIQWHEPGQEADVEKQALAFLTPE